MKLFKLNRYKVGSRLADWGTLLKTAAATVCVGAIDSSAAIGAHLALTWRRLYRSAAKPPPELPTFT